MKAIRILIVFIFASIVNGSIFSQAPVIQWQKTYGSSGDDEAKSLIITSSGNFVIAGYAESNNGDIQNHHGSDGVEDFWFFQIDSFGNIIWSKLFGGTWGERSNEVKGTLDSGFIISGETYSNDGDVSNNHYPSTEVWVVKTDSIGNLTWGYAYGGTDEDVGYDVIQTPDSGYVIIGETYSHDGDVHGFHGSSDIFLIRLNKLGQKVWTRSIGGTSFEDGSSLVQTPNGGFLIAGNTVSNDGNIGGNHNSSTADGWVAKIDSLGAIQWQKCYGGSGVDNIHKILLCNDNGFYFAGVTGSNDGDVSGNVGFYDVWLVRCDSLGVIQWQRCYGGNSFDAGYSAIKTSNGGIVIAGVTDSNSSYLVGNNHGGDDFWIIKVDSSGNFEWGKCLGGSNWDTGFSIVESNDGGFLVAGTTESADGDLNSNHGGKDVWVVKLSAPTTSILEPENSITDLNVSQTDNGLHLRLFSKRQAKSLVSIYDIQGNCIFSEAFIFNEGINYKYLKTNSPAAGVYLLKIDGNVNGKIKFVIK